MNGIDNNHTPQPKSPREKGDLPIISYKLYVPVNILNSLCRLESLALPDPPRKSEMAFVFPTVEVYRTLTHCPRKRKSSKRIFRFTMQIPSEPSPSYFVDYDQLPLDLVEIRFSNISGRGLYAKKVISTGSTIVALRPYTAVLDTIHLSAYCSNCYGSLKKSQRCSACKFVNYCSTTCQRVDWNAVHKHECKFLKSQQQKDGVVETPLRAMGRILWSKLEAPHKWKYIQALNSHKDQMSEPEKEKFGRLAMALGSYIGPEIIRKNFNGANELLNFCCQFASNSFSLTTSDLDNIGVAISPEIALINHSCSPNAVVVFPNSTKMSVVALRPIEAGEEILTSYVDISLPSDVRREELKSTYSFDCKCTLCQQPSGNDPRSSLRCSKCQSIVPYQPPGPESPSGESFSINCPSCNTTLPDIDNDTAISLAIRNLQRVASMTDSSTALSIVLPTISDLLYAHTCHPSSYPLFSLLGLAQSYLLGNGPSNFSNALKINALLIEGAENLYPRYHPVLAVAKAVRVQLRVSIDVEGASDDGDIRQRRVILKSVERDVKSCLDELKGFGQVSKLRTEMEGVLDGVLKEMKLVEELERMRIKS